ncbi:YIP1 family protein [Mameliella sediminis]|uniref:YIP1 family protein n=1 Tax=Mameliella sediminis TaxID=2836866 RepID=UPI001C4448A6|nr:YIP1 family protein [Mameliella sediminis]MBY6116354.1 YIP1 family protein [Antarctobacter heliothermus]MBY6145620.1 YIP1 family protein [Mameliella alba]MBY6160944.1 YIP1 family protein [Mameliella alba]MBY6169414.1 YIP1 family protein [Mameliella alba]
MPVTRDIAASYRRPGQVLRGLMARGASEPRALAYLMGACGVMFVAQWPRLAREAHLQDTELQPALGGALLATMLFLPLIFYVVAGLVQLVSRAVGRTVTGYDARLALFWALLAASPLALLNGLVAGFIGPGGALTLVGVAWFAAFLWFWSTGLREARRIATSGVAA